MNHVTTLDLHRLRYGELDKARAAEVRAHLDGCPMCTERLQAQHAMRAEFEVRPVPAALREASKRPRVPSWVWALLQNAPRVREHPPLPLPIEGRG